MDYCYICDFCSHTCSICFCQGMYYLLNIFFLILSNFWGIKLFYIRDRLIFKHDGAGFSEISAPSHTIVSRYRKNQQSRNYINISIGIHNYLFDYLPVSPQKKEEKTRKQVSTYLFTKFCEQTGVLKLLNKCSVEHFLSSNVSSLKERTIKLRQYT